MGSKFKCFLIGLFFLNLAAIGQNNSDFHSVDSLTYKYYLEGDWEHLISAGTEGIQNGIDYKFLRQRLGFAFYSKGNYYQASRHFEKALSFDSYDSFTLTYLYYSYLYCGQTESAVFITGKMPEDLRKKLSVKLFQPIESIELEYNFKYAASGLRSNPQYFHIGVNSNIGSKLALYQMFSDYKQSIKIQQFKQNENVRDLQPEYFALLKYSLSPHFMIMTAYHYLHPTSNIITSSANLGFLELSSDFGRMNFRINASVLKSSSYSVVQSGIKTGVLFSGSLNAYSISSLSMTSRQSITHFIFDQKAGFKIFKSGWIEGSVTAGDMTYYNDHEAMYIYNLIDATTFRTGVTLFIYAGKHITIWTNYSYERKEYFENSQYHYNQFSYLGGIKWKL